jgi:hypothetical protein
MESRGKQWFALPLCIVTMAMILAASTPAVAQEFIYLSNFGDNNVSGFALNTTTGKTAEVPALPSQRVKVPSI